jgi:membrane protein implicated in regulation of membrane protease activity
VTVPTLDAEAQAYVTQCHRERRSRRIFGSIGVASAVLGAALAGPIGVRIGFALSAVVVLGVVAVDAAPPTATASPVADYRALLADQARTHRTGPRAAALVLGGAAPFVGALAQAHDHGAPGVPVAAGALVVALVMALVVARRLHRDRDAEIAAREAVLEGRQVPTTLPPG